MQKFARSPCTDSPGFQSCSLFFKQPQRNQEHLNENDWNATLLNMLKIQSAETSAGYRRETGNAGTPGVGLFSHRCYEIGRSAEDVLNGRLHRCRDALLQRNPTSEHGVHVHVQERNLRRFGKTATFQRKAQLYHQCVTQSDFNTTKTTIMCYF